MSDYTWADVDPDNDSRGGYIGPEDWVQERLENGEKREVIAEEANNEVWQVVDALRDLDQEIEMLQEARQNLIEERTFWSRAYENATGEEW